MIFLLFMLAFNDKPFGALGAGGPISPIQANMDVKNLHLSLKIDPKTQTIDGFASWKVQLKDSGLKKLEWDLFSGLKVKAIKTEGQPLNFKQDGHKILVDLPNEDQRDWTVRIEYAGTPFEAIRPPWQGGFTWSKTDQGTPWVAVSCQGEGAKVWFPSKDHMSDKIEGIKLEFTIPQNLYIAANGILTEQSEAVDGWTTFTWESQYPISPYNISFGLGEYGIEEDIFKDKNGLETSVVYYYITPHQKADQIPHDERDFATKRKVLIEEFKKYLDFYSRFYGHYPFYEDKAGIVQTPYLGMEHQTINAYGNHYKMENGYDWLLLHELGHEWWGNKVSLRDWRDFWIHEGICTYATAVFLEESQGLETALLHMQNLRPQLSNKKPIVGKANATTSDSYTLDVYYKGALMLHSLRYLLGKSTLDRILYEFAMSPSGTYLNSVTTDDFIHLANEISERDLQWFFNRYLYKSDLPRLTTELSDGVLNISWDSQTFNMPVEVRIKQQEQTHTHRVSMEHGKGQIPIPKDASYAVDPHNWILKAKPATETQPN